MTDSTKKGKVLVVEDETFLRELYQELLSDDGYAVDVCADGDEAMQKLADNRYDLTMLDIMLPKRDGLQIMEEATQAKITQNLGKVVLLTNLGQEAVIKRGYELGAVGYLIKSSYTPNQVLEEIANFLGKVVSDDSKPDTGASVE